MQQSQAGIRTEPAVSAPNDPKQSPAAVAAAEAPDDPPGNGTNAQGLCTGPKKMTEELPPKANSWRLVLPNRIAPAFLSFLTTSASSAGTRSLNNSLAAVVLT